MEWQAIETAPRNGTLILLFLSDPLNTNDLVGWCPSLEVSQVVGWWDDDQWESFIQDEGAADTEGYASTFPYALKPSHWMPLPEPPK